MLWILCPANNEINVTIFSLTLCEPRDEQLHYIVLCWVARGRWLHFSQHRCMLLLNYWYLIYNYARVSEQKWNRKRKHSECRICSVCCGILANSFECSTQVDHCASTRTPNPLRRPAIVMFIWLFSCRNPNENSFKCFAWPTIQPTESAATNVALSSNELSQLNEFIVHMQTQQHHKRNTKWHEILCYTAMHAMFKFAKNTTSNGEI